MDFFQHSADALLYTAPDGAVLDANAAACEMLGMSREEICRGGRARLADRTDSRWEAALEERRRTGRFVGRLRLMRGDGTAVEAVVSSAVFAGAEREERTIVIMREASVSAGDESQDVTVLDASGVCNRAAFVQLAEQQRHHAALEGMELGLVFARVTETVRDAECPSSDVSREAFASMLKMAARWGDVIGRVGRDDFAMLVGNVSGDEVSGVVRPLLAAIDRHNQEHDVQLCAHVGVTSFMPADDSVVTLLEAAALRMGEHDDWEQRHGYVGHKRCCFILEHPALIEEVSLLSLPVDLSKRELDVLRLLATRRSYNEIAQMLYVSVNTIKTHASHVYAKLDARSRAEAIHKATAAGFLPRTAPAPPDAPTTTRDIAARNGARAAAPERAHNRGELFARVAVVSHALTSANSPEETIAVVMNEGLHGLDADGVLVTLRVGDLLLPVGAHGYSPESVQAFFPAPLSADLPLTVATRLEEPVCVPDRDDAISRFAALGASSVIQSHAWAAIPLVARSRVVGALGISFLRSHAFDDDERTYLRALADLCALALRL